MEHDHLTFGLAFDADLKTYEKEQSEICLLLAEEGEEPISTAAISNWKKRDRIPYVRLAKLVQIFGPDSQCARYMEWIESHELGEGPPMERPRVVYRGKAKIIRPEAMGPDVEQRLTRFLAVLFQIPEARRQAALIAATEVLLDHLPPPPTAVPALPAQQ